MSDMNERNLPIPSELAHLSTFIDSNIECLAGPSGELRSIALCAAKHIFDWALETEKSSKLHLGALLAALRQATPPQTRSQARSKSTQERSLSPVQKPQKKIDVGETPLPSLFIEGMNVDQIWQQLDLRAARVCQNLQALQGEDENEDADSDGENDGSEDEDEDDDDDEEEEDEEEEDGAKMDVDDDDETSSEELSGEDGSSAAEGVIDLGEETFEDDENDGSPTSMLDIVCDQQKLYFQGHSGLDDGFFDLATFNAETSELEAKEAPKRKRVADEDSAEESEVDLFGSVDDSESETEASTELFYKDFFAPPGREQKKSIKSSKVRFHGRVSVKKIKAVGKGMPVSSMGDEDSDEDEDDDYGEDSD